MFRSVLTCFTLVIGLNLAPYTSESAAQDQVIGVVTAHVSGFTQPVTAPVRRGARGGRDVLVPGWGWTACGFSCRGALESHLGQNFWDEMTNKDAQNSNILNDLLGLR